MASSWGEPRQDLQVSLRVEMLLCFVFCFVVGFYVVLKSICVCKRERCYILYDVMFLTLLRMTYKQLTPSSSLTSLYLNLSTSLYLSLLHFYLSTSLPFYISASLAYIKVLVRQSRVRISQRPWPSAV